MNAMVPTRLASAHLFTVVIAVLATVAAVQGLRSAGLYRDNALVTAGWRGNDAITLAVAVPALVAAMVLSRRGSLRAHLVWLGMLDYMLYNFAFYLFGAAFNRLFLVYAALVPLSLLALIFGLVGTDVTAIGRTFRGRLAVKWISGFMLLVAVGLSTIYAAQSFAFNATGQLPAVVVNTGHPTSVVGGRPGAQRAV